MEQSNLETAKLTYLESEFEQAEWEDTRYLAEAIIVQLGDDHSSDAGKLWEASWTSDRLQKNFLLSKEYEGGAPLFNLEVTSSIEPSPTIRYGFDPVYYSVSLYVGDADNEEELEYVAEDDPVICRGIERQLKKYLQSATIDTRDVKIDDRWSTFFEEIIRVMRVCQVSSRPRGVKIPTEERFKRTYSDMDVAECESTADYIQYTSGLTRQDAYDAIGYRPPWYRESVDHGEA